MKKILVLSAILFTVTSGLFAQSQKTAYVNTQLIIDTLPAKDSAELILAKNAKMYDDKLKDLNMEIQKKQAEYQEKQKKGATQAQLELIARSYERLNQELQETEQLGQQEMQNQRSLLLKPIVEDIKKAVGHVAAAKGYTSVIDNAAGIVIWTASASDDITGAVIAHMLKKK